MINREIFLKAKPNDKAARVCGFRDFFLKAKTNDKSGNFGRFLNSSRWFRVWHYSCSGFRVACWFGACTLKAKSNDKPLKAKPNDKPLQGEIQ